MTEDLYLSAHARLRSSQRGISAQLIEWALDNGRTIRGRAGATISFVGSKEARGGHQGRAQIGAELAGPNGWASGLSYANRKNYCVVSACDGTIITTYHCGRPPRSGSPRSNWLGSRG